MLLSTTTTGCLITNPIEDPDEVNYPPSIVSDLAAEPPLPIEEVVDLDTSEVSSLTFPVIVRDANIDQTLEYQFYVDFTGSIEAALVKQGEIGPSGNVDRPFAVPIDNLDLLGPGDMEAACHKVELRVSGAFDRFPALREPVEAGDVDVAVWWINSRRFDSGANLDACPDSR